VSHRVTVTALGALAGLLLSGCSAELDASYGRSHGQSLNGTGVLAALFRAEGHDVRAALRLTNELSAWADVIVRFAPYPGPPARPEADWYHGWLNRAAGRRLIYVPRDFDAQPGYWSWVREHLSADASPRLRKHVEEQLRSAQDWPKFLHREPKEVASPQDWFEVTPAANATEQTCKTLEGPWAEGVDPARAALSRRRTLQVESETVLLRGDEKPLAIEWNRYNASAVLVVANGSLLLNAPLVNAARRPLALRVVDWAGEGPLRVAFVEGNSLLGEGPGPLSVFALLKVPPFGWVAAQLFALGLAACLARAPRLGRPTPEPPSGEDRPSAHPEALGALLARTRQADAAHALLDAYRRWRFKSS
jgi:hypothetical protein